MYSLYNEKMDHEIYHKQTQCVFYEAEDDDDARF